MYVHTTQMYHRRHAACSTSEVEMASLLLIRGMILFVLGCSTRGTQQAQCAGRLTWPQEGRETLPNVPLRATRGVASTSYISHSKLIEIEPIYEPKTMQRSSPPGAQLLGPSPSKRE